MLKKLFKKPSIWEYIAGIGTMFMFITATESALFEHWATSPVWLKVMSISWLLWQWWVMLRLFFVPLGIWLADRFSTVTPPTHTTPKSDIFTFFCPPKQKVADILKENSVGDKNSKDRPNNNSVISIPIHIKRIIGGLNKRVSRNRGEPGKS